MNAIFTIAAKEIRCQFLSPRAWGVLSVTAAVLGYVFLIQLERFTTLQLQLSNLSNAPGATELVVVPLLKTAGFLFLVTAPLFTMNLIAEERRQKTIVLLLSSPVTSTQIILGKYLGLVAYLLCLLLLATVLSFSLRLGGPLDYGLLLSGLLGLGLLLACIGAAGLFISCHTELPSLAAFYTFGLLMTLWIINWSGETNASALFTYISLSEHFEHLLSGIVRLQDIVYFCTLTGVFLVLGASRLARESATT
jgi:ABC-2 type transport system permease protein